MIKVVGIIVVVVLAGVLLFAAMKPDTFNVQRSIRINAPADKIFPLINDFHQWGLWSPYEKKDPKMQRSYSGTLIGKGAEYQWSGDKNIGIGGMEITESIPSEKIALNLNFVEPFAAHNFVEFTLQPDAGSTLVTWTMHGPQPYMARVMCLFFNMDKMVGDDFEAGLAALKAAAER